MACIMPRLRLEPGNESLQNNVDVEEILNSKLFLLCIRCKVNTTKT